MTAKMLAWLSSQHTKVHLLLEHRGIGPLGCQLHSNGNVEPTAAIPKC